jgi:hypothetical protein
MHRAKNRTPPFSPGISQHLTSHAIGAAIDQMADFSIFELLRPTFHSLPFFDLPRPQTYPDNLSVKESHNAGRCTEVSEPHFVSIVRVH